MTQHLEHTYIWLVGDPSFSLVYLDSQLNLPIYTDICSYRPDPSIYLHSNSDPNNIKHRYKAELVFDDEYNIQNQKIKVLKKVILQRSTRGNQSTSEGGPQKGIILAKVR
jgi:hypothetical protein